MHIEERAAFHNRCGLQYVLFVLMKEEKQIIYTTKAVLKECGIEGDYEGIGNLILGYAAEPADVAAPRKADYVFKI